MVPMPHEVSASAIERKLMESTDKASTQLFFSHPIILLNLSQMKVPILLCLAFSLASGLAEARPAENSDKSDDAKASAAFLAGDYDAAISLYNEVIEADPKAALAYNGRALAYREKGDLEKALADFDQAIRLQPL